MLSPYRWILLHRLRRRRPRPDAGKVAEARFPFFPDPQRVGRLAGDGPPRPWLHSTCTTGLSCDTDDPALKRLGPLPPLRYLHERPAPLYRGARQQHTLEVIAGKRLQSLPDTVKPTGALHPRTPRPAARPPGGIGGRVGLEGDQVSTAVTLAEPGFILFYLPAARELSSFWIISLTSLAWVAWSFR